MADETRDTEVKEEIDSGTNPETKVEEKEKEPTIQDLMNEIAKLKRVADKNASEAAEYKKKYRQSLSETEKASEEKAEKEAQREEQFQQLMRENTINKIEKSYLAMGWTAEEASKVAIAEADNDFDAKVKIMAEVDARKKKEYEASFLASRPELNAGTGNGKTYTKEQFSKMSPVELTKLKRENEAEYNRLISL